MKFYLAASYTNHQEYMNQFPKTQSIKVVCLENDKKTDCTERTTFRCGEKIELFATINKSTPFYACMNMSFFNIELVCSNKTSSLYFQEPNITIPNANGKVEFIEIYLFPPKDYTTITDFLADMNSSKKIMSLSSDVTC
jgi:hypothetical protein